MKTIAVAFATLVVSSVSCAAPTTRASRARESYVVLLSFDGFAAEFLARATLPNFQRLAARGVEAEALVPAFPSKTFANHYTMATGLYPGHHGIVGSQFYDPNLHAWFRGAAVGDGSWFGGEPIWVTAAKNGVRSATFFWTGSEAEIEGHRPTYYRVYDPNVADSTKVDQVAAWLRLPNDQRPRLIMVYFPEVDAAAHNTGPHSAATDVAVSAADRTLGRMLDSLDARSKELSIELVVVSDHGMAEVPREHVIFLDDVANLDSVLFRNERATASIWSVGRAAILDTVYARLQRRLEHARVYRRAELPARWHTAGNPRFGDLLIVADAGYALATRQPATPILPGEHGYDPADATMRGIFLAAGTRFPVGRRLPALDNVVIYGLLAELLQLPPASGSDVPREELHALHLRPRPSAR